MLKFKMLLKAAFSISFLRKEIIPNSYQLTANLSNNFLQSANIINKSYLLTQTANPISQQPFTKQGPKGKSITPIS